MSSEVYFVPLNGKSTLEERSDAGEKLLSYLLGKMAESPEKMPLKLHFGEKGNRTYLAPQVYNGMIKVLKEKNIESFFTETSVLYGGERFEASKHIALAHKHGFDQLPVMIADGENGEKAKNIPVENGRHFKSAAIAEMLAESGSVLVVSHFKGHILAGFGGALKQLSMGFAAKGGKMAMHLNVKPRIKTWKCKQCRLCLTRCGAGAIETGKKFRIDPEKCIGCGACFAICPHHAVSVFSFSGLRNMLFGKKAFREKLAEYAFASHHGKKNLYITFAVDITCGCDCEPRRMTPCVKDIGVFASFDPVALDSACFDAVKDAGKVFKGHEQLAYAEKIGVGSKTYTLVTL